MESSLTTFVEHARKKGMDHQTIRMLLLSAGWKEKEIASALIEESLDMPVPVPPDTGGAREAFMHLLTFASFYTGVIALSVLFFQYINRLFPDPAFPMYGRGDDFSGIRWSLAAVIVSYPLFLWLTRKLLKEMDAHPERAWSAIRRWLTYITLFLAAGALIGDVITLVFYLLEGELTIRFILKVLVVLVLAGCTFAYYLLSLRMREKKLRALNLHRGFGIASLVIVAVALIWGIVLAGSPGASRDRRLDERRVQDLQAINNEILNIALGERRYPPDGDVSLVRPLPETLEDVQENAVFTRPTIADPETGEPYGYDVTSDTRYRLCATFTLPLDETYGVFWNHPAGRHCYEVDALTPTLY